ncbi:MAG: lysylphosphatidylglycerol synthase transmembrane domain-containing protein [Bacilli bacterium]|jgi:uncharacterized protein (TIRG00374 family)
MCKKAKSKAEKEAITEEVKEPLEVKEEVLDTDETKDEEKKTKKPRKKMSRTTKYILNIVIILLVTGIYAWLTLRNEFDQVVDALKSPHADYRFAAVIVFLVLFYVFIDGLVLFIFARLHTTTYKLHRGVANAYIGQFFCNITPSASGGQFAQAVTFKKQGVSVSNAASILVMHHILYQIVILIFGGVSIFANINTLGSAAPVNIFGLSIPVWVFAAIGYTLNVLLMLGLFLLASSKKLHNWTTNKGVNIGHKLKLIRDPEEKKKKLMLSTENFRVELRRLQSNVPVAILIMLLFLLRFFVLYSIPYFVIVMLEPSYTQQNIYLKTVVSNSFLRMITDLFPLPGAAGFTEYFFERLYLPILGGNEKLPFVKAVQIIWRFATFYVGLIVGGLVSAFYRSSMEKTEEEAEEKTFTDLQKETIADRTISSDTAYETSQLSVVQIKKRLKIKPKRKKGKQEEDPFDTASLLISDDTLDEDDGEN